MRTVPLNAGELEALHTAGACAHSTVDFFPQRGEDAGAARALCASCPVADLCLTYALTTNQGHGIWAGTSAKGRQRLRRELGLVNQVDEQCEWCGGTFGRSYRARGEKWCGPDCARRHRDDVTATPVGRDDAERRALLRRIDNYLHRKDTAA